MTLYSKNGAETSLQLVVTLLLNWIFCYQKPATAWLPRDEPLLASGQPLWMDGDCTDYLEEGNNHSLTQSDCSRSHIDEGSHIIAT